MTDIEPAALNLPAPTRIGQATAVESYRAVAEVQAAIIVARDNPRSISRAMADMEESCSQRALADRAFYRYNRGGSQITGPSVHLARELARCWENVQYGVAELRRDDDHAQSEMLAFAWDVQKNTRVSNTFVVPHKRDRQGGPVTLVDMRDIYENNTNAAARRLREAIFAILPPWFVERAKELCGKALAGDPKVPMATRVAQVHTAFAALGVTVGQLEEKLGRDSDHWTDPDIAQLRVVHTSLSRGEVTRDEEFPPQRVTAAEVTSAAAPPPAPAPPAVVPGQEEPKAEAAAGDWPDVSKPGSGGRRRG